MVFYYDQFDDIYLIVMEIIMSLNLNLQMLILMRNYYVIIIINLNSFININ